MSSYRRQHDGTTVGNSFNVDQPRSVMLIPIRLRRDLIHVEGAERKGGKRVVKNDTMANNSNKHEGTNKLVWRKSSMKLTLVVGIKLIKGMTEPIS